MVMGEKRNGKRKEDRHTGRKPVIARYLNNAAGKTPRCYVRYISEASRGLVPLYEGQALEKTVQAHLESAGCTQTCNPEEADFVLALTGPTTDMLEAEDQFAHFCADPSERSLQELVRFLKMCGDKDLPAVVGDNAYANGGDLELIRMLNRDGLLFSFPWPGTRAANGDSICREEIARMCDVLAKGIANLCFAFNPEVVVIGGGISAQEPVLRPLLEKGLDRYLIPAIRSHTSLRFAACGNRAGMLGAYYAWRQAGKSQNTWTNWYRMKKGSPWRSFFYSVI